MERLRLLPFQIHVTLRVALLVLVLTASFLWVVLGQVERQIEEEGRDGFRLQSHSAFTEVDAIMRSYLLLLDHVQSTLPLLPDPKSRTTQSILAQMLLPYEDAMALYVTRASGEISYVLRVDGEAPPASAYTTGQVYNDPQGRRWADITYYTVDNVELSRRRIDATLIPRSQWYPDTKRLGQFVSPVFTFPGGLQGFTLFTSLPGDAMVGVSMTVALLDRMLGRLALSANGAALLLDDRQRVVAMRLRGDGWRPLTADQVRLNPVADIGHPALVAAAASVPTLAADTAQVVTLADHHYLMAWHSVLALPGMGYRIVLLSPLEDLSLATSGARRTTWLLALGGLLVVLPLTWFGAGVMARRLQGLVRDSERIARMDFTPAPVQATGVRELQQLVRAQDAMRVALQTRTRALEQVSDQLAALIETGASLVHETDRARLVQAVLAAAREVTRVQAAALFVRDDTDQLRALATSGFSPGYVPAPMDLHDPGLRRTSMVVQVALAGEAFVVDDAATDTREPLADWLRMSPQAGLATVSVACLPLRAPDGQIMGVMQLFNARDENGQTVPFGANLLRYAQALAAQAAVALDKHRLVEAQRQLLDALVRILADAVDAKSPYTGRHSARVPALAMMLGREAHAATSGPLAAFGLHSDEAWREFHVGAALHDCGKVTTPEHVIDKATKLETVYNRLHEVRMRFEVVLRDARIEALQDQLQGRATAQQAEAEAARRAAQLVQEFAFLAACNQGSEAPMTPEDMARVRAIGQQRWQRHFDDRLGLSWHELALRRQVPAPALPASETLLADQPWHLVPRDAAEHSALTEGFQMRVPAQLYNLGEVYNLCVARGTLTEEERFKVNEHIIHTIRMLESAHFPAAFRRVPEYAGTHHETLDGLGYPRGLRAEALSVPARIMAIADIFEALTAQDRPYKQGKPLSEALAILQRLVQRGKIDADLFALFLRSGVYLRYAQRFLVPAQIDSVDIEALLKTAPEAGRGPDTRA